jgi:CheY-like chemotaxis protein
MNAEQLPSHLSSILIVDDEPDICLALEDLLRHAGYTVRSVMTGREALHEAEQSPFGAVILDLGLPDLSGFAVLRGLEELDPPATSHCPHRIRTRQPHGGITPPGRRCLHHQAL